MSIINLDGFFDSIGFKLKSVKMDIENLTGSDFLIPSGGVLPEDFVASHAVNIVHGTSGSDDDNYMDGVNASLQGNAFFNIILAGGGNDVLVGNSGLDILLGGSGIDVADYSYIDQTDPNAFGALVDLGNRFATAGGWDIDILGSIENAIGTTGADFLLGNALNNVFNGNGGKDFIDGRLGDYDVAQFAGDAENYSVASATDEAGDSIENAYLVTNNVTNDTTMIINIEILQFQGSSGGVTVFHVANAVIARDDTPDAIMENESIILSPLDNDTLLGNIILEEFSFFEGKREDGAQVIIFPQEVEFGTLDITDGELTFIANSDAAQALNEGDLEHQYITYTTIGGEDAVIDITISGSDDATEITADLDNEGAVIEDTEDVIGELNANGILLATDVDNDDETLWVMQTDVEGDYGTFTLEESGEWSYELNSELADSLNTDSDVTETFDVATVDGQDRTVTVSITGSDDATEITADLDNEGTVIEDTEDVVGELNANGTLLATDVDNDDETLWVMQTDVEGDYGTFTLEESGEWSYELNSELADSLNTDSDVTETFDVATVDGQDRTVTVSITGSDDATEITPDLDNEGTVIEDTEDIVGELNANGTLIATDVDNDDETLWVMQTDVEGDYGTFTLEESGEWSYELNSELADGLNTDSDVTETFDVATVDGQDRIVTVSITGSDDATEITADLDNEGTVIEDAEDVVGELNANGTLLATDVDNDDETLWVMQTDVEGDYGTFTLEESGEWSYELNSELADSLNTDSDATETFDVATVDGQVRTVTMNITGANDLPIVESVVVEDSLHEDDSNDSDAIIEGDNLLSGVSDLDNSGTHEVVGVVSGTVSPGAPVAAVTTATGLYGILVVTALGEYSYTLDKAQENPALNALNETDTAEEVFTFSVSDNNGGTVNATITFTVIGVNDNAIITGEGITAYETDEALTLNGSLTSEDADNDDSNDEQGPTFMAEDEIAPNSGGDGIGSLSIDDDGNWQFEANSDFNELTELESRSDTFTVSSIDGTVHEIEITIKGTNDAPIIVEKLDIDLTEADITQVGGYSVNLLRSDEPLLNPSDVDTPINELTIESIIGNLSLALQDANGDEFEIDISGLIALAELNPDGTFGFSEAVGEIIAEMLEAGDTATFTAHQFDEEGVATGNGVTVSDGHNGSATADLDITLIGSSETDNPNDSGGDEGGLEVQVPVFLVPTFGDEDEVIEVL